MYQPPTPPSVTPHSGRTALIYGVIAGLLLGVIQSGVVLYLMRGESYSYPYATLSIPFSLLFWVLVLLISGILAGKRTGKVITGTLAGLWAGMVGGIITAVTVFATVVASAYTYDSIGVMAASLTVLILLILGAFGIGTGLGALGGLIGQSFSISQPVPLPHHQHSDPPQSYQAPYRQSDPPQQEMVQYQQNTPSYQEYRD